MAEQELICVTALEEVAAKHPRFGNIKLFKGAQYDLDQAEITRLGKSVEPYKAGAEETQAPAETKTQE